MLGRRPGSRLAGQAHLLAFAQCPQDVMPPSVTDCRDVEPVRPDIQLFAVCPAGPNGVTMLERDAIVSVTLHTLEQARAGVALPCFILGGAGLSLLWIPCRSKAPIGAWRSRAGVRSNQCPRLVGEAEPRSAEGSRERRLPRAVGSRYHSMPVMLLWSSPQSCPRIPGRFLRRRAGMNPVGS